MAGGGGEDLFGESKEGGVVQSKCNESTEKRLSRGYLREVYKYGRLDSSCYTAGSLH